MTYGKVTAAFTVDAFQEPFEEGEEKEEEEEELEEEEEGEPL